MPNVREIIMLAILIKWPQFVLILSRPLSTIEILLDADRDLLSSVGLIFMEI